MASLQVDTKKACTSSFASSGYCGPGLPYPIQIYEQKPTPCKGMSVNCFVLGRVVNFPGFSTPSLLAKTLCFYMSVLCAFTHVSVS